MRQSLMEIPEYRKPLERNVCTYCGDSSHSIQKCEVYNSHHDMGEHTDLEWVKGREEVLARRKAMHFGGIMEMYLRNPTAEQRKAIAAHKKAIADRMKESMAEILATLKKSNQQLDMERGFSHWSPYCAAVRRRNKT